MPTTSIVASLDDSTLHVLTTNRSVAEVVSDINKGILVECESDFDGNIFISPSMIRWVKEGRARLPVSASPGSNSQAEHARLVSPTMG